MNDRSAQMVPESILKGSKKEAREMVVEIKKRCGKRWMKIAQIRDGCKRNEEACIQQWMANGCKCF